MAFTYLLGAGASFKTLPLVASFPKVIEELIKDFHQDLIRPYLTNLEVPEQNDLLEKNENLLKDLSVVYKASKEHASIDTYAKKLDLLGDYQKLVMVKSVIDLVLTYQHVKNGVDFRYDTFFATLLIKDKSELKLPNSINLLSWNYDVQVEASLSRFRGKEDCDVGKLMNIMPNRTNEFDSSTFSLLKLNGSIGYYRPVFPEKGSISTGMGNWPRNQKEINELKVYLIERHSNFVRGAFHPTIHYSWEDIDYTDATRKGAYSIAASTQILVVIGYSFPTFNRQMDHAILNKMSNLTKVYIQTPTESFQGVKERMKALRRDLEIYHVENLEEFYIPFEYGL
ncbi:MAG: hypothetical protein EOO43_10685 [Flavobacterium sp.]|nr:MAG: hypothetical protein EOO43_10685 [Flavobacterium sp.]